MIKDLISAAVITLLLFAAFLLFPSPGRTEDRYPCALWSRELVMVEAVSYRAAKINLVEETRQIVSVELDGIDASFADMTEEQIEARAEGYYGLCLLQENQKLPLPVERDTAAWAKIVRLVLDRKGEETAALGSAPATGQASPRLSCDPGPCLEQGTEEWRDYCETHWRSYRRSDDTVVRHGNKERVPCPA